MKQESLSLQEFQEWFCTEDACEDHLFQMRWPGGYNCPRCGHDHYYVHGPVTFMNARRVDIRRH